MFLVDYKFMISWISLSKAPSKAYDSFTAVGFRENS